MNVDLYCIMVQVCALGYVAITQFPASQLPLQKVAVKQSHFNSLVKNVEKTWVPYSTHETFFLFLFFIFVLLHLLIAILTMRDSLFFVWSKVYFHFMVISLFLKFNELCSWTFPRYKFSGWITPLKIQPFLHVMSNISGWGSSKLQMFPSISNFTRIFKKIKIRGSRFKMKLLSA